MPTPATMPHVCTAAVTGRQPAISIFSNAMTTPGYCSCTKRNCSEAHRPAGKGRMTERRRNISREHR